MQKSIASCQRFKIHSWHLVINIVVHPNPPRHPGLRACRLFVSVLPTLRFYCFFPGFRAPPKKLRDLPPPRLSDHSKRPTDLKNWPSEAKYLEESDFDIQNSPDPPKSDENHENQKKKSEFFFRKKFFGVKKSKIANRPKRVLPKFRGDRSHVRRVRGRLGGIREA